MRRRSWRCCINRELLFPLVGESLGPPIVASEPVDPGFDQDESIFGVLVLPALLEMPADVDSLLDEAVDVLGDLWRAA